MSLPPSAVAHAASGQMYAALRQCLTKGAAHASEKGVDEAVYLGWRQVPDMFPLSRQVQIACDIGSRGLSRMAGVEPPSVQDTEASFADLIERVGHAEEVVRGLDPSAIDADPEGPISFPVRGETMTLPRRQYLVGFVLANLYFHTTMTYALLRGCGVSLGKLDFLGGGPSA